MGALRWFLQIAILFFGGATLLSYAYSDRYRLGAFLGLAVFFALLFFFTALIRDRSENQLTVERDLSSNMVATILGLLSVASVGLAISILNGFRGGSSRRGALLRVTIDVFGALPPAVFFLLAGLVLARLAYERFVRH